MAGYGNFEFARGWYAAWKRDNLLLECGVLERAYDTLESLVADAEADGERLEALLYRSLQRRLLGEAQEAYVCSGSDERIRHAVVAVLADARECAPLGIGDLSNTLFTLYTEAVASLPSSPSSP